MPNLTYEKDTDKIFVGPVLFILKNLFSNPFSRYLQDSPGRKLANQFLKSFQMNWVSNGTIYQRKIIWLIINKKINCTKINVKVMYDREKGQLHYTLCGMVGRDLYRLTGKSKEDSSKSETRTISQFYGCWWHVHACVSVVKIELKFKIVRRNDRL